MAIVPRGLQLPAHPRRQAVGHGVGPLFRSADIQAGQEPVYFASQFYGSGRVFYLGSAEMWRLRRLDGSYFEKLYTKLIRHVSQGRLLRGSNRGVLLVGQDQGCLVGSTVQVRTQLTNSRLEPLEAPRVSLQVFGPDHNAQTVALRPDTSRAGTFVGHFTATHEGTYRLELPIPDSGDQRLTRRIQVRVPDLELESPQRNDALLTSDRPTDRRAVLRRAQAAAAGRTPIRFFINSRTPPRLSFSDARTASGN